MSALYTKFHKFNKFKKIYSRNYCQRKFMMNEIICWASFGVKFKYNFSAADETGIGKGKSTAIVSKPFSLMSLEARNRTIWFIINPLSTIVHSKVLCFAYSSHNYRWFHSKAALCHSHLFFLVCLLLLASLSTSNCKTLARDFSSTYHIESYGI